jgi:Zn finger protein HypA/HybF involved in hydrogenase expression
LFTVWRDRGSQFLAQASIAVGDWLQQAGDRLKQQTYRTGEMTAGGVLECTTCGERIALKTTAHLPLCPKCKNMEFRRV